MGELTHTGADEYLLYDFKLEVGDSATVYSEYCGTYFNVHCIDIDTIEYEGIQRKRWKILSILSIDYWIEGIGSVNGLFYTNYDDCIIDQWHNLLCCYMDDTLIYLNEYGDPCYLNTVNVEEINTNYEAVAFPNPATLN